MKITRRQFVKMAAYAAAATGVSQFDIFKLQKALAAAGDQIPVVSGLRVWVIPAAWCPLPTILTV